MLNLELHLFRSLPFTVALRVILLSFARDVLRIPVSFSFSQGGEDILIPDIAKGMLGMTSAGNYVDVGCNAPIHYSNTFNLYLRGWRGLNIDANYELIKECQRVRRDDISICAAVSDSEREATFHKSKDTHLMATIDETQLSEWRKHWDYANEDVVQSDVYLFLTAKGYRLKNYAFVNLYFYDAGKYYQA